MLVAIAAALVVGLVVGAVLVQRRQDEILSDLHDILRRMGDEAVAPRTIDDATARIRSRFVEAENDISPRRALAALDQVSTAVVVVDTDNQVVLRNSAAEPYDSGRHSDALVAAKIRERLADALAGRVTDEELRLHGPPERVLFVVGLPLVADGEIIGAMAVIDDVSEQQRLDAIRRDFVANVSHELRTPVGAMSLLAETVDLDDPPELVADVIDRIRKETLRLANLIDDLLDLSRIEGGLAGDQDDVVLSSVVEESADAVREAAAHKRIELSVDVDEPFTVSGDRSQLVSAVVNLLDNAIKYTDRGGKVTARVVGHGREVAITVVDNGIGIPQRDQARLFERFYRVDKGRSAETGGTGLGLAIVRNVAVNHGGRVEVVSHEGVGSTFSIVLPALPTATGATSLETIEPPQ